ncbi:Sulfite reductase [NADPH] flavoprotein alpha-component [Serratia quinivorans]|uniref:NADPH-dependent assimilatory sulfite reductase flavoprotein subunit n=1 Tax=Serratia quinivorans TaxID=137545 RepID=UPI0021781327|nr:NADPH-dependent assimilatory sulfite reductase flavoprotein subunit [Serratia quinivorans]CAI1823768.1 Sulfite reductase [NADPH] flavoprotein alpha-component [Serratia quinivorans]CAI1932303.1 Sulfite reductase [NADPH] flavoprotein alpha-component [Serratia quinivorans]CAI2117558.1 Sulfite reductase [NADPH] flavoprotein alpha-component [Serratia quinivorans]CAI2122391.1 Sulfite reductase [NADPH] flavoprotein alpha-component [Serratia quinivorans]CAI2397379.1 Sulfite reductase [NADPH] flavop
MTTQAPPTSLLPLTPEQLARLQAAIGEYSPTQLAWLSGYFWGMVNQQPGSVAIAPVASAAASITLISASQTGNARRLAEQLRDDLLAAKLSVTLVNAGDYKFKQIAQERLLVIVASTQGEGEPAEEAVALHKFLFSKKAPKLNETAFAVFGLGDTSYENFCQSGKDFDSKLAELGAERLVERVDADVEYQELATAWRKQVVEVLKARAPAENAAPGVLASGAVDLIDSSPYSKEQPLTAQLAVKQKITGRASDKDVRHIEIDLGDSRLRYRPGDALGVWFDNDPALVDELVQLLWLKGDEPVEVEGKTLPLAQALRSHFELTQNTTLIVDKYSALSRDEKLIGLLADKTALQHYAHNTPIVDMVRQAPADLNAEQLIGLLRPLTPRLYSIASSQAENENEVHVTVGVVRYDIDGRARSGGASSFLADRLEEDGDVRVFIEHNDNFRLPANPETPVIMIGPGTGIAPFRAFMQQRDADGAAGKNWLFFGNPHFTEDFLYQVEWQRYVKDGLLTRIDLAWSRDQQHKVYVQDKLREQGAEVWRWIQEGAHIYVCGDANRMAKDVENTLLELVAEHGGMDTELADEFLSELRLERRYQRDVY